MCVQRTISVSCLGGNINKKIRVVKCFVSRHRFLLEPTHHQQSYTISSHEFFNYVLSVSPFLTTLPTRGGCCRAFGSSSMEDPFHSVNGFRFSLQSPHTHMLLVRHPLGCKTLPCPICRQLVNSSRSSVVVAFWAQHHHYKAFTASPITIQSTSSLPLFCSHNESHAWLLSRWSDQLSFWHGPPASLSQEPILSACTLYCHYYSILLTVVLPKYYCAFHSGSVMKSHTTLPLPSTQSSLTVPAVCCHWLAPMLHPIRLPTKWVVILWFTSRSLNTPAVPFPFTRPFGQQHEMQQPRNRHLINMSRRV
jgi:hypothetical protein